MDEIVAGVNWEDAEDLTAAADEKAPDPDRNVKEAEPERVLARGEAGDEETHCTGDDVEGVGPTIDGEGPECIAYLAGPAEGGAVEEAEDASDNERRADQRRVQP